jgi:hypothetical protein
MDYEIFLKADYYKFLSYVKDLRKNTGISVNASIIGLLGGIFCCLVNAAAVYASAPIVLTDKTDEWSVTRSYVDYYVDPSASLKLSDILEISREGKGFIPSTAQDLLNNRTSSAYWLRFDIVNSPNNEKGFLIELFDFNIDELSFFYPDSSGVYKEERAGFASQFSSRKIGHKNISFPIPFRSDTAVTVFMRFKSDQLNLMEPIIRSYERFIEYGLKEYILFGIFYGLLLLMVFYNILYFIILRNTYYFYYVSYALAVLLFFLTRNGVGFQFLWCDYPEVNAYIPFVSLFICTVSILKFFIDFFELKKNVVHLYRLFRVLIYFRLFCLGIQIFFPPLRDIYLLDLILYQVVFYYGIQIYRSGINSAKWFVVGFSILNFCGVLSFLEGLTLIPSTICTVYSINVGVIFQLLFLSICIAEKVRQLYAEKNAVQSKLIQQLEQNDQLREKVNRELEERVKERTLELNKAKQELERRAEENLRMNIALDLANNRLQKHLSAFAQTVVMNTHVDFEAFKKAYPDDLSCMRYLSDLKEKSGFCCKMCGNTRSIKGKGKFDMRCSKCNYNESLTANTIFHRTKFSLQKAFYMLYLVSQTKTDIPATELARMLDLQSITCQNFKNKIHSRMQQIRKAHKTKEMNWELLILDKELVV